uniref:Putative secreted protein n=1 Tax=Ixodes ricinus TaxID=34613 RepID=A0A6B0UHS4_IXORI
MHSSCAWIRWNTLCLEWFLFCSGACKGVSPSSSSWHWLRATTAFCYRLFFLPDSACIGHRVLQETLSIERVVNAMASLGGDASASHAANPGSIPARQTIFFEDWAT